MDKGRDVRFATELYVVRSALNGAAWIPCVLLLQNGQLSLVSANGTELAAPITSITVKASALGKMQLTDGSKVVALSGIGGATVPLLTASLEQLLLDFRSKHPDQPRESRIDVISQWMKILNEAGATVSKRPRSFVQLVFVCSVTTLVVGCGLVAIAIWLASQH